MVKAAADHHHPHLGAQGQVAAASDSSPEHPAGGGGAAAQGRLLGVRQDVQETAGACPGAAQGARGPGRKSPRLRAS